MNANLDSMYLEWDEPQRSTLLALRGIILRQNKDITETEKYGMPCFLYRKKILCYLWTDRKTGEPYFLLAAGNRLDHPQLEQGNRSRMKILRIDPSADIPIKVVETVLRAAIAVSATRTDR